MSQGDRYLATDGLRENLGRRSVRSALIRIGGQAVNVLLMLGTMIFLARFLGPRDFGLFAMVNALIAFAGAFKDWGFPMATVHHEAIDHEQVNALFWLTLKLNAAAAALMALAAPAVAWFYGEPRLTAITIVMAGGFFCLGLGFQHESLLMRQMRFGTLVLVESSALAAGLAVAIASAWLGAGYWALVLQFVTHGAARSIAAWSLCGWRPSRPRWRSGSDPVDLTTLISYGGYYTGYRVVHHIGRHIDRVLLGYFRGATAVGLYDNAFRWSHNTIQHVYVPLQGVAVASLSRLQHHPEEYRSAIRRGLQPVLAVVVPTLVFLSLEAPVLIPVVVGERWIEAVPLLRLLAVSALATSMTRLMSWLYLSQGQTRRQLRWALISTPPMIVAVAIGLRWGALGVAAAMTIVTWLLAYPTLAYCLHGTPIRMRDMLGVVASPALASATATVALLGYRSLVPAGAIDGGRLAVDFAVYALSYLLCWSLLPGGRRAAHDLFRLVSVGKLAGDR